MSNRRKFLGRISSLGFGIGLASSVPMHAKSKQKIDNLFFHHVFFWLKDPDKPENRKKFEKGLKDLASIETIVSKQIGIPADTDREVIDNTYHYSFLAGFQDKSGHDVYQTHKKHLNFIDKCQHLWDRVLVYDSVSI